MITFEVKSINERKVNTKYGMKSAFDFIATDGSKYGFGFNNPSKYGITIGTKITGNVTTGPYGMNLDKEGITVGGETSLSPTPTTTTSGSFRGGAGASGRPFPVPTTSGEMAIIRQNALTNAVATVADFVATQPSEKWPDLDTWTDMVITVAYKFAKFSSGQRETEAMKRLAGSGVAEAAELSTALDSALEDIAKMTMVRLVDLIGEIKYPQDVDRIKRVFKEHFGLSVSEIEAQAVWLDHSDTYCAGWLFMPEDDLELVRILSMYVEEVE